MRAGSVVCPHPTVGSIVPHSSAVQIPDLQPADRILGECGALLCGIDSVEPCGVEAEDLCLVLIGELGVAKLLAELVGDLESFEGSDDPLRRSPPRQSVPQMT